MLNIKLSFSFKEIVLFSVAQNVLLQKWWAYYLM